jgi:hypothetical protein
MQNFARVAVDNNRSRGRRVGLGAVNSRDLFYGMAMAASVCGVAGQHDNACNGGSGYDTIANRPPAQEINQVAAPRVNT